MPQAIAHFLIPALIVSIIRDFFVKKKFSLHYVLIAGLAGVLPDIDIAISVVLNFLGKEGWNVHKTFTHSLFIPVLLFAVFLVLNLTDSKNKIFSIGKQKLKLSWIFLMLSLGILIHILLDALFGSGAFFFYPFGGFNYSMDYGVDLIKYLPYELQEWAMPVLDGAMFIVWIFYLEIKHKISDFI